MAIASAAALAIGATAIPAHSEPAAAIKAWSPPRLEQAAWSPVRSTVAAANKPNIVVIMLDDLGPQDGRLLERLPVIDSTFVERGTTFGDFHVQTPVCSPGRAGFLTGQHTHNHGVTRNVGSLFRPSMTIATQLHRSGYRTILAGKYLNSMPGIVPKVPPGWDDFHAIEKGFYDYTMWSNGKRVRYGSRKSDYSTDVIARKAVAAIRKTPKGKKVFAWVAPYAVHQPNLAAPRYKEAAACQTLPYWKPPNYMEKSVSDKPKYVRRFARTHLEGKSFRPTCRVLLAVDDLVRDIKAELKRQDRLSNTLFILTADNGMNDGAHRLFRDKKTPYATQVPFLVSWPKVRGTNPQRVDEKLLNIDLAPTLCELAGCRMGPYPGGQRKPDGRSFARVLRGESKKVFRGSVLHSYRKPGQFVPMWWGIETTRHSKLAGTGCSSKAQKGCRWSYVEYSTGAKELYDLSHGPCYAWNRGQPGDPCRLHNVAGQKEYRGVQNWLAKRLRELRRE